MIKKPNICKILNLEVGEEFKFGNSKAFFDENGFLIEKLDSGICVHTVNDDLARIIQNPDKIVRNPRCFTRQEINDAKVLERVFSAYEIERNEHLLVCYDDDGREAILNWESFPSIKEGETIKVSKIIG